jgi:hypothetical protein
MAIAPTTAAEIVAWTRRVAELEQQLDAATKLAQVKAIAGELNRTKKALKEADAKAGRAVSRPTRGKSQRSVRRTASSAAERATS